jgi:hypothetical protein
LVAEAKQIELITTAGADAHIVISIQTDDHERTRIKISGQQLQALIDATSQCSRSVASPVPVTTGLLVVNAREVRLIEDRIRETASLLLDSGAGLRCLVPLTTEIAERLLAASRAAARLLRSHEEARTIN